MKNSNRFVSRGVGILLALMLVSSTMRAQPCPTDIYPTIGNPNYVAWTNETPVNPRCFTIPNTNCSVCYYYCDRTVVVDGSTTYQVDIYEVDYVDTCNFSHELIIDFATDDSYKHGPVVGNCNQLTTMKCELYKACCWIQYSNSNALHPCGDGTSHCLERCDICYWNGGIVKSNCSFSTIGTPSTSCSFITNPPADTCFRIHCGDEQ